MQDFLTQFAPFFRGKNILIGVSASVAIYKILDLVSTLNKLGANTKIVMSKTATEFINPILFEALSKNIVLCDESQSWSSENFHNHIGFARGTDVALLAPASANTIAKLANGIADNALTCTFLALDSKNCKLLAPAMNTNMLNAPATQENLKKLENFGYEIISSRPALLACGDFGDGALAEVSEIVFELFGAILRRDFQNLSAFWRGKNAIITAGGSIERIDCVRTISNLSSGKQGALLALALCALGANVKLITSASFENLSAKIQVVSVKTAQDFKNAILDSVDCENFSSKPFLFMSAAIADFLPEFKNEKIKKESTQNLTLTLQKNIDILSELDFETLHKIGFKAEVISESTSFENALQSAKNMLERKKCLGVCLNIIDSETFGGDFNEMHFFARDFQSQTPKLSKLEIALEIAKFVQKIAPDSEKQV